LKDDKSFQFRESTPTNRALDIKDENGDTKLIPAIKIYDIDYAILWQLQKGFKLRIDQSGNSIEVPVVIANAEKWAQIQRYGALRGKSRQLTAPVIVIKRTSMERDSRFAALDGPIGQKLVYIAPRNNADRFNNLNTAQNVNQSNEILVSVIPVPVKVEYELLLWTNLQTQMNHLVEQIQPFDNEVWGDQFQFNTVIGPWAFETLNSVGDDRVVRATTTLTVDGMLRNEHTVDKADVTKAFGIKRVDFKNAYEEPEIIVDYMPKIIKLRNRKIKPVHKL